MKKEYKLLLFDADGTLFDYDKGEAHALKTTFEKFRFNYYVDIHLPKYRHFNSQVWKMFEDKQIDADSLKVERFRKLFIDLGFCADPTNFSEAYLDALSQCRFLLPGALEILDYLNNNYKLLLITNGLKKVQRSRLKGSEIEKYFPYVIISEEVGSPKPETGIFEKSFELAEHSDKNSAVIIGDSLTSDIKGGENFGIDTVWFNPLNKVNSNGVNPTFEIKDLAELKNIL
ncbi:MAG: YjjG family noncanonical pyrimidine nucleotidase [Melioribacteraceae bacterium]|nr:YjjG family noncanonical pyrimidine nucleotidase [Melioribacteraceae bacterium]